MRHELAATVGKIIARHRNTLGMTQEQLSLALDVDPVTISRFERGVSLPSLTTLQRLCEIYGLSLSQFFADLPASDPEHHAESLALLNLLDSLSVDERQFFSDTLTRYCRQLARPRRQ